MMASIELKKIKLFTQLLQLVAISLLTCLFIGFAPSYAKTLSVPETAPTIKGALAIAKPGDIVLVSCGTYFEHDIWMKPGVALWSGTLQPGCVTIDAQGKGRHFIMTDADSTTALVGFTLTGGNVIESADTKGGSILFHKSSPRISNCVFKNNTADNGGAIATDKISTPVFANCLFDGNNALSFGGGALCEGKSVFRKCAFENNQALVGAGLALKPGASVLLRNSSLQKNSAGNAGGGMHMETAHCDIANSLLANNWGGLGGSAFSIKNSDLLIVNSTLYKNRTDIDGGTLAIQGPSPLFTNCILAFGNGPVLRSDSEVPNFQGCNLFGNEGGDWVANLRILANKNANISSDPMFCSPEFGNFNLNNSSSCLPDNNPSGNKSVIGAFGPGCASNENNSSPHQSGSGFRAVGAGL